MDSGCSKGIIGQDTLKVYREKWRATGGAADDFTLVRDKTDTIFRFGNDDTRMSNGAVNSTTATTGASAHHPSQTLLQIASASKGSTADRENTLPGWACRAQASSSIAIDRSARR